MMDESREEAFGGRVERLKRDVEELRREVRHAMRAVESGIPEGELYDARRRLGKWGFGLTRLPPIRVREPADFRISPI
jgi:hypothetical protein